MHHPLRQISRKSSALSSKSASKLAAQGGSSKGGSMKQSKSATAESDWIGVIPEVNEEEVDEADGEIPQEDRDVPKVTFSPFPPPPSALSLSFTLVFTPPSSFTNYGSHKNDQFQ